MKISRAWLQRFFDKQLPNTEAIADALTFHAFEIEETADDILDVKVLPNRAADCLSHRGVAMELSAILDISLTTDPLRAALPKWPNTNELSISVKTKKTARQMGALVRGVTVGPSPAWLKESLESVGQKSINNIVDSTNFVTLHMGQPLHAFDADKIHWSDGALQISIRETGEGEKITALSGEEYLLPKGTVVIAEAISGKPLDIAGIKGGMVAAIDERTSYIYVSVANFDGTSVRRTAQALKLFTDASLRFQNRPSPELAAYGMRDVLALITAVAGGEVVSVVDEYPVPAMPPLPVFVSLAKINSVLGSSFGKEEVESVFKRLGFEWKTDGDAYIVTPPFERTDITVHEDLVEEVGRILGYDKIPAIELLPIKGLPDQARYRGIERMKDQLVEQGFTEVSTQSFVKKGDIYLANPLDKTKPALRTSLLENLREALEKGKQYAPLVLLPNEKLKLFEIGTVFPKTGEYLELRMTERVAAWGDRAQIYDNLSVARLEDYGKDYVPKQYKLGAYKPFSVYPFIIRDVALWVPKETKAEDVETIIRANAGELARKIYLFDTFEKDDKKSFAFRVVLQSFERTLEDAEANAIYDKVVAVLEKTDSNWVVRK
ncbi:MAG: phenylalanine--tRNA ligase subunit beta [Patescibacteria group bacterium]